MKLSTTVDEMREIRDEEPLEDTEKGGKLLVEMEASKETKTEDNGGRSDTIE